MTVPQDKLLHIFIGALFIGFFLGIIYDVLRMRRIVQNERGAMVMKSKTDALLTFCEDVCFFFVSAIIVCIYIFYMNSGRLRLFALFCIVLGLYFYKKTVQKAVLFLIITLKKVFCFIFQKIYTVFLRPLLLIVKFSIKITLGRIFFSVLSAFYKRKTLRLAEKGMNILKLQNKERKQNEKKFKYIRQSGDVGVHRILRGNHSQDAV